MRRPRDVAPRTPVSDFANWAQDRPYAALKKADRNAFAWEWLRRTTAYREAWAQHELDAYAQSRAHQFGLERLEDPDIGAPFARILWTAAIDPAVIQAVVIDPFAAEADQVDLRLLSHLVTLFVDSNDIEHILLSDGVRGLRIDVIDGTLIGCPSALAYALQGLSQLRGPIAALNRLAVLVMQGRFENQSDAGRRDRWILELRVADALGSGASYQQIARGIFGELIPDRQWRGADSSYRYRVQRLVRIARTRLLQPLDSQWFIRA